MYKGTRRNWSYDEKDHRCTYSSGRIHETERRNQFQRSGYRLMAIRGCTSGWLWRCINVRWNLRGRPRDGQRGIIDRAKHNCSFVFLRR